MLTEYVMRSTNILTVCNMEPINGINYVRTYMRACMCVQTIDHCHFLLKVSCTFIEKYKPVNELFVTVGNVW